MSLSPEFFLNLVAIIGGAFGAYAAIRADLRANHVIAVAAKDSADKAHLRLDNHLEKGHA